MEEAGAPLLPDSLVFQIFLSLGPADVLAAGLVCRQWRAVARDEFLWREQFYRYYQVARDVPRHPAATSWYEEFQRLYDAVPCVEVQTLREHTDQVLHLSFAHSGGQFASCSKDCTVKIWSNGLAISLLHSADMRPYNWSYTQFSQFNQDDSLLLASGVFLGPHNSSSGEIAVISLGEPGRPAAHRPTPGARPARSQPRRPPPRRHLRPAVPRAQQALRRVRLLAHGHQPHLRKPAPHRRHHLLLRALAQPRLPGRGVGERERGEAALQDPEPQRQHHPHRHGGRLQPLRQPRPAAGRRRPGRALPRLRPGRRLRQRLGRARPGPRPAPPQGLAPLPGHAGAAVRARAGDAGGRAAGPGPHQAPRAGPRRRQEQVPHLHHGLPHLLAAPDRHQADPAAPDDHGRPRAGRGPRLRRLFRRAGPRHRRARTHHRHGPVPRQQVPVRQQPRVAPRLGGGRPHAAAPHRRGDRPAGVRPQDHAGGEAGAARTPRLHAQRRVLLHLPGRQPGLRGQRGRGPARLHLGPALQHLPGQAAARGRGQLGGLQPSGAGAVADRQRRRHHQGLALAAHRPPPAGPAPAPPPLLLLVRLPQALRADLAGAAGTLPRPRGWLPCVGWLRL